MSAAVITIVMLLAVIAIYWYKRCSKAERKNHKADLYVAELERIIRSHQLAAEQSRAHARADERQWADDEPARIWRNK